MKIVVVMRELVSWCKVIVVLTVRANEHKRNEKRSVNTSMRPTHSQRHPSIPKAQESYIVHSTLYAEIARSTPATTDSATATAPALLPRVRAPAAPDDDPPCACCPEIAVAVLVAVALAAAPLAALGVGVGTTPVVYARTYWISNHALSNAGLPGPLTSHTPGHVCW